MATVNRFEDLDVWQISREIANGIFSLTKKEPFSKDFALRNQIRRSSISILSKISEGFESGSDNQLARYLKIAKGSAGECRAQLCVALDQSYVTEPEFDELKKKLIQESKKITRLIGYLKGEVNYTKELEIIYNAGWRCHSSNVESPKRPMTFRPWTFDFNLSHLVFDTI